MSFRGRVQGVGFRAKCRSIARGYDISGWVRNEPDGSVTLEAQGDRDQLTAFTRAVETRLLDNIADVSRTAQTCEEPAGSGFQIQR